MGYNQSNNPLPRMNSALKIQKDMRKMGVERKSSPANNASQYGVQGVDELKYMPIVDDMHRKQDSPAHLDAEEKDGKADNKGMSRYGAMKGDQSATHTDYANYKGTDKGYHGHDGSSHGDQSATHRDYTKGNAGCHHVGGKGVSRNASPLNGFNSYTDENHKHPHKEGISMSHGDEGMSRHTRSHKLRQRAMKISEASGAERGDEYDYENPQVMKLLQKANKLDKRSGKEKKKDPK
tara:strand:- start:138 stop:845 length:708 start_codon:yes stop_codon:yes gene_type:complete